ncbi:thioredoxin [Scleroderma citrinum]
MGLPVIKSLAEFTEIINRGRPVIIDFTATWCGPCRVIGPIFEKFSGQAQFSGVDFYKIDVDDSPDISQEVGIRAMPTFMVFNNGNKVDDLVGADPKALERLITVAATLTS